MKEITLLGIDLAKQVYQAHGVDCNGKAVLRKRFSRKQLLSHVANLKPCVIAIEACAGAHYFSRKFQGWEHEVRLMAPQFVKPYIQGNKNDVADAEGICEAASRPKMNFVATKQVWQQDLQIIHRIRQRLVRNKTALMNEIRGFLYENGIVISQGEPSLITTIIGLLKGEIPGMDLSVLGKELLQSLYSELLAVKDEIEHYEIYLKRFAKENPEYHRLNKIGGLGLISITALLVALSDPKQFKNGRQFSAWTGLVPRHSGTGGKNKIMGISKRGNPYLRSLLVHGARAQLKAVVHKVNQGKTLTPLDDWVFRLYQKKGWNKAAVALANKNARIAWALMNRKEDFDSNKTSKAAA